MARENINNGESGLVVRNKLNNNFTELYADIANLPTTTRTQTAAMLVAGANITLTQSGSGATRQVTIAASGGGGSGTVTSVGGTGTVAGLTLSGTVTASGNLTLGGTLDVPGGHVTLARMANLAANSLIGNATGSAATPSALTAAQVRTLINVADGATANATDAALRDRATHTGAQAISTVTGLQSALDGKAAAGANADITSLRQSTAVAATGAIGADTIGFRGLPSNAQTAAYTLALDDAGRMVEITTGGVTIPANAAVAFPVGTTIVVYNDSAAAQSIAITSDTLRLAGTGTTGTRSLAQRGFATLVKVAATEWVAQGNVT